MDFLTQLETIHWIVYTAFATWMSALSWAEYQRKGEAARTDERLKRIEDNIGVTLDVAKLVEAASWKTATDGRLVALEKDDTIAKDIKPLLNDAAWKTGINARLDRAEEILSEAREHGGLDHATMHERITKWTGELRGELTDQQKQLTKVREDLAGMKGGVDQVLKSSK